MKVRSGFVSNSSSSSFIIATKDRSLDDLADELKIEFSNNPLAEIMKPLVEEIVSTICSNAREMTLKEWLSDWGYASIEEAKEDGSYYGEKLVSLFERGFKVYTGGFSDECTDGAETMLCYSKFKVERDDFYAEQDGGY